MKQKHYTIGAIQRLGLLLNKNGKPYKQKTAILRIVRMLKYTKIQTPWGEGYSVPFSEIEKFNHTQIGHMLQD